MKKLWILGVAAVAALTSCSNEEVVDVPSSRAITFSGAFVNKTSRADVTTDNIRAFRVFGDYDNSGNWVDVFNNVEVTGAATGAGNAWATATTAYWLPGKSYNFAGYADGDGALTTGVSYDPATNTLAFTGYSAGDKDLVAATSTGKSWDGTGEPALVNMTFSHMLSKVKFTFNTEAAETYTMAVSDLKISNAVQTADGSFSGTTTGAWTGEATGEYGFDTGVADFATAEGLAESEVKYVIPQSGTDKITVSFKVTLTDGGALSKEATFTGTMAIADANQWTAGVGYNYSVTINPEDVDDTMKPIRFEVVEVEAWDEFTDSDIMVAKQ